MGNIKANGVFKKMSLEDCKGLLDKLSKVLSGKASEDDLSCVLDVMDSSQKLLYFLVLVQKKKCPLSYLPVFYENGIDGKDVIKGAESMGYNGEDIYKSLYPVMDKNGDKDRVILIENRMGWNSVKNYLDSDKLKDYFIKTVDKRKLFDEIPLKILGLLVKMNINYEGLIITKK